jgi:hypothetical protein
MLSRRAGKRGKARESGPELRKCADSGYEGMGGGGGGQRDAPGALWCSVACPAGAAAYQRKVASVRTKGEGVQTQRGPNSAFFHAL